MQLAPIVKQTTADAVFEQLAGRIVAGELLAGAPLPSERALVDALGVSRAAVREALQRLAQAGLLEISQGESTRVRDLRDATSLDLLPRLLVRDGRIDPHVVRSILELRITIGEDAARWCAVRATDEHRARLADLVEQMGDHDADVASLQALDLAFWSAVVDGADNIAYRIAFNGLVAAYAPLLDLVAGVVAGEVTDVAAHRRILSAVDRGRGDAAARAARALLESSGDRWTVLLHELEEER